MTDKIEHSALIQEWADYVASGRVDAQAVSIADRLARALEASQRAPLAEAPPFDVESLSRSAYPGDDDLRARHAYRAGAHAMSEHLRRHERPGLNPAAREGLVDLVERFVIEHDLDMGGPLWRSLADAILADYRPVATTRERVARWFYATNTETPWDEGTMAEKALAYQHADHFLASGAVEDREAVEERATQAALADLAMVFRNITYVSDEDEALRHRVADFIDKHAAQQATSK